MSGISTEEIRKLMAEGKLILGTSKSMRALEKGLVSMVIISSNTDDALLSRIKLRADTVSVPVHVLSSTNAELGVLCRRPHAVAVIAVRK